MGKKLFELSFSELQKSLIEMGEKKFCAKQIADWVYQKGVSDWTQMTNLSQGLRDKLTNEFENVSFTLVREQHSDDEQTIKFLWKLHDDRLVESVLIMSDERRTVCVSSQVGCPARCAFCASGQNGFMRNLEIYEIVLQVFLIQQYLAKKGERVSHIVYMGMGEPFRNYENVVQSIKILCDPEFFGLSQRRITVSTVGVVEGISRFANEGLKVNLVLSLHAPNQKIRQKIIPYARQYPIDLLISAMRMYSEKTKRDITFEYTLLSRINDQEEHAEELAGLLKGIQCTVNLIPYNPVPGIKLHRPETSTIKTFWRILEDSGIVTTCRYTKGDDIKAACGQLALQVAS